MVWRDSKLDDFFIPKPGPSSTFLPPTEIMEICNEENVKTKIYLGD